MFLKADQHAKAHVSSALPRRQASGAIIVLCAAILQIAGWLLSDKWPGPAAPPAAGVVVVKEHPVSRVPPPAPDTDRMQSSTVTYLSPPPELTTFIQQALGDEVTLRDVSIADADKQIYCGILHSPPRRTSQRFIWLASVRMLAIDDGTGDFAQVAYLCRS